MNFGAVTAAADTHKLAIHGVCNAQKADGFGPGAIALLGPKEPGFWAHVCGTEEFSDSRPDPLDRWSLRVINDLAEGFGATALFPFGAPARPFLSWASRSQRAWSSPVGLLVHDEAGLLVSFRGALFFPGASVEVNASKSPCENCVERPCLVACPVGALTSAGYDLDRCHRHLDNPEGAECLDKGCLVRLACPVSQAYERDPDQSGFHMRAFHRPKQM